MPASAEAAVQEEFQHLYRLLHLEPGCSLEEFQRAYRRAIAELHPDRLDPDAASSEKQAQLRELISLHSLATEFQRRHGRLPGAGLGLGHAPASQIPIDPMSPVEIEPATANRRWLIPVAVLAFIAWQIAGQTLAPNEEQATPALVGAQSAEEGTDQDLLVLGIDPETAIAIQGQPEHRSDDLWYYGPSWLKFEDDRLVDWYSSPLHRLKTATTTPPRE